MEGSLEYLFAAAIGEADQAAPQARLVACGRSGLQKPDGTVIHLISFVEQMAIVPKAATVYVVGERSPGLARFKRKWTIRSCLENRLAIWLENERAAVCRWAE
jgi:hypothetical protein